MVSMAYNAARDSQEGVLCKLVDELRDSSTKETGLALTALLLHCWREQQQQQQQQQQQHGWADHESNGSRSSSSSSFSFDDVDAASEAFLQRRFGLQVGVVPIDAVCCDMLCCGDMSCCREVMRWGLHLVKW
jgi:hypothetical protein